MCGIAGLITKSPYINQATIAGMLKALAHRGPDDQGYLAYSHAGLQVGRNEIKCSSPIEIALVHRRLSILDLSETGWQPMVDATGRYYIVFNGEIYNYIELRQELQRLGHHFRSQSDTEVLLAGYIQWGTGVLNKLVGMFAFAVLDTRDRKLFLARDFFGIKPLYYSAGPLGFFFASEIKVLLHMPGVSRRLRPAQAYVYLRYGLTDHGPETMLEGVNQVPPAHYVEISCDTPELAAPTCYWSFNTQTVLDVSFEEAADRVRDLFLESIKFHLRSDVPVGAALSGGIDSSSIVMAMRHVAGVALDLHTFSYIANDPRVSEERWVDIVTRASGAIAHKLDCTPEQLVADLDALTYAQDEPFGTSRIYAQYRVFRLAREAGIKVMLDGQGADEILGGYTHYLGARLASLIRQQQWREIAAFIRLASKLPGLNKLGLMLRAADYLLPPGLQQPMRRLIGRDVFPNWLNPSWFRDHQVGPAFLSYTPNRSTLREHLHRTMSETSLPHLLRYEDRNSMAFSIESRVPFLTPQLVSFLLSLPEEYIIAPDGTTKAVFRRAMRGIVPDAILDRKDKIGFETPEARWLHSLNGWVTHILDSEALNTSPVLNVPVVKAEWAAVVSSQKSFDSHIWRWINFAQWISQFAVCYG